MSLSHFRVKVCGVSCPRSVAAVAASQADAIGLNFCSSSPRFLSDAVLGGVLEALPAELVRVGVFVNSDRQEIESRCESADLDLIQLSGDEPTAMIADLPAGRVIRSIRYQDVADIQRAAGDLERMDIAVAAFLIDAYQPGAYGGTGKTVDWKSLRPWREWLGGTPLILAGGLTVDNVESAINTVQPSAVDTASGVEAEVGLKDPLKTKVFAERARLAFDSLSEPE